MFCNPLSRCAMLALPVLLAMVAMQPVNANSFGDSPKKLRVVEDRDKPGLNFVRLKQEPKEEKGTFSTHEEKNKRFTLMFEAGLEKKEPAIMTMVEAREAIGRVETRMGGFKEKFALVVVTKLGDTEDPMVSLGTFGKEPAVLVTFNGTTTPVIAHGMGMLRMEELKTKAPVWLRHGGGRIFSSADGFDDNLFEELTEAGGPVAYKDADRYIKDADAEAGDKLRSVATGWMLMYYCTELAKPRATVEEVLKMKDADRPDPEKIWKAVKAKGKEREKKGD